MSTREVELTGGAPWGFRMHGGSDQTQPLRISRVNPGRKASLSGIREGDVITSINGQPTKNMSNADAHAMLRSAGPLLRLGLNEDREMSPRRRSIGKASELKRPSQLVSEFNNEVATPQAPVYATIRTVNSPKKSSPHHPSGLSSISLVKSAAFPEELKLHPTNPFFTTLPTNYTSASKLPVPNGKVPQSSFEKSKNNKPLFINGSQQELNLLTSTNYDLHTNKESDKEGDAKYNTIPKIAINDVEAHHIAVNDKNPFQSEVKKFREHFNSTNGNVDSIKKSDNDYYSGQDSLNHSVITERKISEIEEIKTVKKIILNGSSIFDSKSSDQISQCKQPGLNGQDQAHLRHTYDNIAKSAERKSMESCSNGYSKHFSPQNESSSRFFDQSPMNRQSTESYENVRLDADTLSAKSVDIEPSVRSPIESAAATKREEELEGPHLSLQPDSENALQDLVNKKRKK